MPALAQRVIPKPLYVALAVPSIAVTVPGTWILSSTLKSCYYISPCESGSIIPTPRDDLHCCRCRRGLSTNSIIIIYRCLHRNCSKVASRAVRVSHNHCQSPSLALSCSWWSTRPGNNNCHFSPRRLQWRRQQFFIWGLYPRRSGDRSPQWSPGTKPADIVCRFWLQKRSTFENFAQFISWFLTSVFHGVGWAKRHLGA